MTQEFLGYLHRYESQPLLRRWVNTGLESGLSVETPAQDRSAPADSFLRYYGASLLGRCERTRPRELRGIPANSSCAVIVCPIATLLRRGSSSTTTLHGLGVSMRPASLNSPRALETASRVQATMQERSWWLRRILNPLPRPSSPKRSASSSKRLASRLSTFRSSSRCTAASRSSAHSAKAWSSAGAQLESSERWRSKGPLATFATRQAESASAESG